MSSLSDSASMIQTLKAACSDRPALVHPVGAVLSDRAPKDVEDEVAAPGCWVHDGSDLRGYVGTERSGEDVIEGLWPNGSPVGVALVHSYRTVR
jgi:hypothetical protein